MQDLDDVQRTAVLQEGVSCALATVHAINAADLFRDLPADPASQDRHNHGLWLLAMLNDHLRRIQEQVDTLDAAATAMVGG
ncbi:hypothetical protein [Sphingomonas aracearum]|uniref:Uncharacterized protein n=1 Tax=Sphingomonas aracearum TaxID=2283317 RepID=A0A369VT69_9SPHN|nr:hypothetical protein [Sphingomonas aracearum]RDE05578.1 hypothetical protein DVW87_10115 [Sphingomonas aracearum]